MVDRKLGRGLDFFLSDRGGLAPAQPNAPGQPRTAPDTTQAVPTQGVPVTLPPNYVAQRVPQGSELRQIPIAELVPNPRQPRAAIEPRALQELVDSIRASGVLQPILARRVGQKFEIVAGERRWRAAKEAGLAEVPVVVRTITDEESGVFALVENLQRADLNAMEKARAFRSLIDTLKTNQEELGRRLGMDRSTVANFLRLLDLAPGVQDLVSRGTLSMGHARALLAIRDVDAQVKLAEHAVRAGWSVRALEEQVREIAVGKPGSGQTRTSHEATKAERKAAWLKEIEETLCETLGTPTVVRYGRTSSVIQITCAGRDEFERVFNRLKNC